MSNDSLIANLGGIKMRKVLAALLLLLTLLTACQSKEEREVDRKEQNTVVGTFKGVTVVDKKKEDKGKAYPTHYYILVEKNGQKVQLQTFGEESFNAIQKGNVLDVSYNKDFYILKIKFTKFEEEQNGGKK